MIASLLLILDFILLGAVFFFYFRRALAERSYLRGAASRSLELQQKVYQIEVLKEVGERIGYSLDTNKIIEIITGSVSSLLKYDTVSVILLEHRDHLSFKCHVENAVNERFIETVKEKMSESIAAICGQETHLENIDRQITGNILDNKLKVEVASYVNVPIIIGGRLLALINVASSYDNQYGLTTTEPLYAITSQAATAVSQLQTVLENEKGKLSAIIYSMADGVMMVNQDNQLLVYNPAVVDALQLPVGKPVTMFDIIDALAGKVDLRTKIEEAMSRNVPVIVPEIYLRDKAFEITVTPVLNRQGQQLGVSVILHDITSEKSLEKLRQEFTAMMVHELRAPLTAARWSSQSMLKNLGPNSDLTKLKEGITTIESATGNMLDLVNDLLDVAKIEAGKFDLNIQEYDLVAIMREEVKAFTAQAEMKHLAINLTTPDKFTVKCDRVRVSQVLNNLISNAIKYTDSGQIDLNLNKDEPGRRAVVAIKDSGVGVSREDLAELFSKFKQLKSIDRSRKGTGLGLVVSKGIVEAHGGQIWAESAGENLGTTFYFSLPV